MLLLMAGGMQNSQSMPRCKTYVGTIYLLQYVSVLRLNSQRHLWGLSITGAASAVSSSSHVTRPPQPSRDVRRLASRRLRHSETQQWLLGSHAGCAACCNATLRPHISSKHSIMLRLQQKTQENIRQPFLATAVETHFTNMLVTQYTTLLWHCLYEQSNYGSELRHVAIG